MKSLVLFRKIYNTVHCCCLYTPGSDTKERIEQLCVAGNSPLGKDAIDKYKVSLHALWVNELIPPMEPWVFRLPKE